MKNQIIHRIEKGIKSGFKLRLAYLLIIFILTFTVLQCDKGNPVTPDTGTQGKLVFGMTDSTIGSSGIYTMNLDGSNLKGIAVPGDTVYFPGPWGDYYVLTNHFGVSNPRWSPDGRKIACTLMWADEGYVIMTMNADGSNKHVLWKVRSAAINPIWSPEGDKILFMRSGALGGIFYIGIVDSSGENDRDFYDLIRGERPVIFEGDSIWVTGTGDFQWGNNNNSILGLASVNQNPDNIHIVGENPANEIFSFNAQTGEIVERLTHNNIDEGGFKYSRLNQLIAFDRGGYSQNDNEFYILSLSNEKMSTIQIGATINGYWNWSNKGDKIIYAKDEDPDPYGKQDFHLYVFDINNLTEQVRLSGFKAVEPDLFIPDL